jgi:hypothetical protein
MVTFKEAVDLTSTTNVSTFNMKVVILVLAIIAAVYCGNQTGDRRIPKSEKNARLVNDVFSAPVVHPCKFDCLQLVNKADGSALFSSCANSVVSYTGDYYGNVQRGGGFNINYQCFTPDSYNTQLTSRGKLAYVIGLCQDSRHRCVKAGGATFDTNPAGNYSGLPKIANLKVVTTAKYYQWYSLYNNVRVVNNVVRCPPSFRLNHNNNGCNCDSVQYPELFDNPNAQMPTAASDAYSTASEVPTPVNPYSSYVNGFMGDFSNINPSPTVSGNAASLLLEARLVLPTIKTTAVLGCISNDVDITGECDSA